MTLDRLGMLPTPSLAKAAAAAAAAAAADAAAMTSGPAPGLLTI